MAKYLYNDVELLELPEYDKNKFPYACICYAPPRGVLRGMVTLLLSEQPMFVTGNTEYFDPDEYNIIACKSPTTRALWYGRDIDGNSSATNYEWVLEVDEKVDTASDHVGDADYFIKGFGIMGSGEYVLWSNHDIYTADTGALYLAASDPVPVGGEPEEPEEPETPEPTPQDFYVIKNGVGQKQDVYLRVGGQWVKQDEYLI